MRILLVALSLLWSTACFSQQSFSAQQTFTVLSQTTISTDNWYPLSEQDMKAAAVDTALAELTNGGRFHIVRHSTPGQPPPESRLLFAISLVGPAEVVKLTTELHLNNQVSYVASVSMNIHNLDYRGIYEAFEFVGTESAKRLNAKLALPNPEPKNPAPSPGEDADNRASAAFNQAQALKRDGHYHQARALFEQVAEQDPATRWSTIAQDELRYGLPMFEADNILPDNAMQEPTLVLNKMLKVTHLYRQILADNTDNPQRVVDINLRLDQLALSLKHMKNAIKASALSRAMPLRFMLMEHLMETGKWPEPDALARLLANLAGDYDVLRYEHGQTQAELVIRDNNSDIELLFSGDMRGITLKTN